jgi:hypothetical protein
VPTPRVAQTRTEEGIRQLRRIGWLGLALATSATIAGLLLAAGAAFAAGDWYLAPMPWIGIGITLIVAGLAGGACFAVLLDLLEPVGWWRLLAAPPVLLVGGFWAFVLFVGVPTSAGPEFDVATVLYSMPEFLALLVPATVALALPAIVVRVVPRRRPGRHLNSYRGMREPG